MSSHAFLFRLPHASCHCSLSNPASCVADTSELCVHVIPCLHRSMAFVSQALTPCASQKSRGYCSSQVRMMCSCLSSTVVGCRRHCHPCGDGCQAMYFMIPGTCGGNRMRPENKALSTPEIFCRMISAYSLSLSPDCVRVQSFQVCACSNSK